MLREVSFAGIDERVGVKRMVRKCEDDIGDNT
jgi:hypothetical protein